MKLGTENVRAVSVQFNFRLWTPVASYSRYSLLTRALSTNKVRDPFNKVNGYAFALTVMAEATLSGVKVSRVADKRWNSHRARRTSPCCRLWKTRFARSARGVPRYGDRSKITVSGIDIATVGRLLRLTPYTLVYVLRG